MPTLADILKVAGTSQGLALFPTQGIEALDSALFEKSGNPHLKCLATGKDCQARPEEIVRQRWLRLLTTRYGHPASRIRIEYPITFRRDTSKRADIVVMDADRPTAPYLVVEVKQGKLKDGKETAEALAARSHHQGRLEAGDAARLTAFQLARVSGPSICR